MILKDKLLEWNKQGLFPGPHETTEELSLRVNYCLQLFEKFPQELDQAMLNKVVNTEECWKITKALYDFSLSWVPLIYSNRKLALWHGGCAWIFQQREDTPLGAFFQLRRVFQRKETFLGIYHKNVILAHEAVHAARMAFEEPKFEEFFAYKTSLNRFQKYFGPLAASSKETALFVFILFLLFLFDCMYLWFGRFSSILLGMHLIPLGMAVAALGRLWVRHRQLDRCIKQLSTLTEYPVAVACRLTDAEIIEFGGLDSQRLSQRIQELAVDSLRWQVILTAYVTWPSRPEGSQAVSA